MTHRFCPRVVQPPATPPQNSITLLGSKGPLKIGHFRPVLLAVLLAFGFVCGFMGAILFCLTCILCSVVLWLRGLVGVFTWWRTQNKSLQFPDVGKGAVMPGAWGIDGRAWKIALNIVEVSELVFLDRRERRAAEGGGTFELKHF